ncbi:MAG: vitamin K epoxide reductase family protein [Candidatus Aenigmarchaeota archaeon]|nr:vitamin K epoxide reductase family protein [Candidatus Aenigmarchaeota archaeon]
MEGGKVNRNLKVIIALSVIAIIISGYLLYIKYSGNKSFCDIAEGISCDQVSQSPYSELPANSGIPIAGLGIIAFLIYIIPAALMLRPGDGKILGFERRAVHRLMLLWGAFSFLFYIYLTYLELFVIYAICPLCVVTFIIDIIVVVFIAQNVRSGGKG